jgi:hypothetical protein
MRFCSSDNAHCASPAPGTLCRVSSLLHISVQCLDLLWVEASKLDVLSFVDDTHSPTAELLNNAVVRDRLPNELGGCAHWQES